MQRFRRLRCKASALGKARANVRDNRLPPVPAHLRDGENADAKRLGRGAGYEYAHDAEGGVTAQDFLGVEGEYYRPVNGGI